MTTPNDDARAIRLEVEVPGTPEQVWQAIATGPGISAWMHPTEVDEREGGRFSFDMGSGMTGSGRVTGWDPPHRFAQEEEWQPGQDGVAAALLATEWRVEARAGGTCVVRMVLSGFGTGAGWDDEIEGMTEGMRGALVNLRLYLTHFQGRRGTWIRAFGKAPGSLEQGWTALAGALGLADAAEGERFALRGAGVPALSGVVEQVVDERRHRGVLLRTDEPAPGIAHALVYGDRVSATVQACLYGDEGAAIAARDEPAWRAWMDAHFPATRTVPQPG
jgi:uncharacterized protein YndB with AHSA1/START domain